MKTLIKLFGLHYGIPMTLMIDKTQQKRILLRL